MINRLSALALSVLIFCSQISVAQTYHPFPDTLAQWSEYSGEWTNYSTSTRYFEGYLSSLAGDTIIQGQSYALLAICHTWSKQTTFAGQLLNAINYTFQPPGEFIGALRTDSSKRVWFRKFTDSVFFLTNFHYPIDTDILIYDFNLQVGDSVSWKSWVTAVVQQIDSIQLNNGEWRRRLSFGLGDYWIEGVGSTYGLLSSFLQPPLLGGYWLNCFRENGILLYDSIPDINTDCDQTYTSIDDLEEHSNFIAFPNPAKDFITFDPGKLNELDAVITIYNENGKQLRKYTAVHSSKFTICTSEIGGDGFYFYMINLEDGQFLTGKFLIQR